MKNRGLIIFLTVIISLLSIYYLQFTFVSQRIQNDATEFSRNENGNIDFKSKQRYLDSIWNKPVYTLLSDYTYKEIKESELNLGLDLQGGMHVTLEVSPVDILKGLSSNNQDKDFLEAIQKAKKNIIGTQLNFITEFYNEFKILAPDKKLSTIFSIMFLINRSNASSVIANIPSPYSLSIKDCSNFHNSEKIPIPKMVSQISRIKNLYLSFVSIPAMLF